MLIKPRAMPADPTKICKTCSYYDPNLHVCCANDYAIFDEDANTMSCSDWNPKKICITCDYFDPDTNECWFEEHDMSEEESMTRTCESWEPRKEVPLQPDGSLKLKAKETIGATIMGQGITSATLHIRHCGNCLHQKGDEMCSEPGKPSDKGCKNWEPEPLKATVTFQYEEKQPEGKRDPFEIPKEAMKALQYSESDMQELRGRTLEALDMMTAIAIQQMPGSKKRWVSLRKACIHALRNHWKHHDEAIKPYREEAKSHE